MRPAGPGDLVSVVIAAYNAAATLSRCIDSVLAQSYEPFELLVVDDGSTDETAQILATHPARDRFTAIRVDNGGQSRARNLGVERARGEWVAFFDADCLLHPDCLAELMAAAEAGGEVASVGGLQCSPEDDSAFGRDVHRYFEGIGFITDYVREGEASGAVETDHNPSCNVLYRRRVFEDLGGYDEGLWVGEDPDLDRRASTRGHRHLFQARAIVYHYRSPSPAAFARKMTAYGRGQMMLVRRYGIIRNLHYVPPVAVAGAVLALAGLWLAPWATVVALLLAAAAAVLFVERLRRRSRLGPVAYHLFFLNVTCWLKGFFAELVRPRLPPLSPELRRRMGADAS